LTSELFFAEGDACAAIAMQRGSIRTLRDDGHAPEQESVALPESLPRTKAPSRTTASTCARALPSPPTTISDGSACAVRARAPPPLALDRLRRARDPTELLSNPDADH